MIIILGNPGAGKTTQTRLLADHLGWTWFSMGELVRQKATGEQRRSMLAGKIISDEVVLSIIDHCLADLGDQSDNSIWEGTPRSVAQAQWWLDQQKSGRVKLTAVIHLVADTAVAQGRLVKRGRLDDHNDNVVETRFKEYGRSINPTLAYLKDSGVAVYEISANGSIEKVAAEIRRKLGA